MSGRWSAANVILTLTIIIHLTLLLHHLKPQAINSHQTNGVTVVVDSSTKEKEFLHISNSLLELVVRKDFKLYRSYCLLVSSFGIVNQNFDNVHERVNIISDDNAVCRLKILTPYYVLNKGMYCAKLVKASIHKFCDKAIWIDTHYMTVPPDKVVDVFGGHSLVLHRHWGSHSLENEVKLSVNQKRYVDGNVLEQMAIYKSKFGSLVTKEKEHFAMGLFSVDMTMGDGSAIAALMDEWWWHNYLLSFQDQVSFPLLMEIHKIRDVHILGNKEQTPCSLLDFKDCYNTKGTIVAPRVVMSLENDSKSTQCDGNSIEDRKLEHLDTRTLFELRKTLKKCIKLDHPSNLFINLIL